MPAARISGALCLSCRRRIITQPGCPDADMRLNRREIVARNYGRSCDRVVMTRLSGSEATARKLRRDFGQVDMTAERLFDQIEGVDQDTDARQPPGLELG